ncbi:MAG: Wzz/FepE/Etk N-terminal domain-containing protein [Acidobacteriota bacterium]
MKRSGSGDSNTIAPHRQPVPVVYPAAPPNTLDIFRKLKRRKLMIVLVALLVIVPAGIATYMATPLYISSALLQINADSIQVLPYRDVVDPTSGVYYEEYMSTQDQALRSTNLMGRVAEKLQADPTDPALANEATVLWNRYNVRRLPNTQLFEISYQAPSPPTAARVINIFAEEYINLQMELRQGTRERIRQALQKDLAELERKMETSEKGLFAYARRENIVNAGPGQSDLVQKRLESLDQQVAEAQGEVATARNRLELMQRASTVNIRRSWPMETS